MKCKSMTIISHLIVAGSLCCVGILFAGCASGVTTNLLISPSSVGLHRYTGTIEVVKMTLEHSWGSGCRPGPIFVYTPGPRDAPGPLFEKISKPLTLVVVDVKCSSSRAVLAAQNVASAIEAASLIYSGASSNLGTPIGHNGARAIARQERPVSGLGSGSSVTAEEISNGTVVTVTWSNHDNLNVVYLYGGSHSVSLEEASGLSRWMSSAELG